MAQSSAIAAASVQKGKTLGEGEQLCKIRITLSSIQVKPLEKACAEIKKSALDKQIKVSGPIRLPTRTLKITVRKSPCGEGSNTWDRLEMRIHKRIMDIVTTASLAQQVSSVHLEPGVDVELYIR